MADAKQLFTVREVSIGNNRFKIASCEEDRRAPKFTNKNQIDGRG